MTELGKFQETVLSLLKGPCIELNLDLVLVTSDASAIALDYAMTRLEEVVNDRASDVLQELSELSKLPRHRWRARLPILSQATVQALMGEPPFASIRISQMSEVGGETELIPARRAIENQHTKEFLRQSETGLVSRSAMPKLVEAVCRFCDEKAIAGIFRDLADLLRDLPDADPAKKILTGTLAVPILLQMQFIDSVTTDRALRELDGSPESATILLDFIGTHAERVFLSLMPIPGNPSKAGDVAAKSVGEFFEAAGRSHRKAALFILALRNPSSFEVAIEEIIARIEHQYGKQTNPAGLGRRVRRQYIPHATWVLIRDVLDRIWPLENGPIRKKKKKAVQSIVGAVHDYGNYLFDLKASRELAMDSRGTSGIGNKGSADERLFNPDHLDQIASYRNAIWQLDLVLKRLEWRHRNSKDMDRESQAEGEVFDIEVAIEAIQDWRAEIQVRLSQGIYEKRQRRKTSLKTPRLPQMSTNISEDERVAAVIRAAKPLIEAIVLRRTPVASRT